MSHPEKFRRHRRHHIEKPRKTGRINQQETNILTSESREGNGEKRLLIEALSYGIINLLELKRAALVHRNAFGIFSTERNNPPIPQTPESTGINPVIFQTLQNSGDFYDGFWVSFLAYNVLALINPIQSVITRRRIPEKITLSISLAAGTAAVLAIESGLSFSTTPDIWDIPAGLAGVATYAGIHSLAKRISGLSNKQLLENR